MNSYLFGAVARLRVEWTGVAAPEMADDLKSRDTHSPTSYGAFGRRSTAPPKAGYILEFV